MKNNDHILANSINDLPVYEPDESVIDKLENTLFQFPVVDMPEYAPSDNLWNDIETTLTKIDKKPMFKRNTGLALIVLLLTLVTGYQIYNANSVPNELADISKLTSLTDSENGNKYHNPTKATKAILHQGNSETTETILYHNNTEPTINIFATDPEKYNTYKAKSNIPSSIKSITQQLQFVNRMEPRKTVEDITQADYPEAITKSEFNRIKNDLDCSEFTGSSGYYSIGLSGGYNIYNNVGEATSENNIASSSVMLNLSYNNNRMYYTTGIGIAFSTDYSKLEYSYLKNELINTYENVDSMYYDPITGTTEFFTVIVEVYDSIEYQKQEEVKTKYNYIQIPVSIGYKFINKHAYSVGIEAGVTYIFMQNKKEYYPSLQTEGSRLLSIDYVSPERRKNFFRFDMQLDLDIKLTPKLHTIVSPSINFYSSSVYNDDAGSTPYSIGLKAGIFFNF